MPYLPDIVTDDERLARFIVYKGHVRANATVKPDAFVPSPHVKLSVTRHRGLTETMLWQLGADVAVSRKLDLIGRADVACFVFLQASLDVRASPLATNVNHADVCGWPFEKAMQKLIALEIAQTADY